MSKKILIMKTHNGNSLIPSDKEAEAVVMRWKPGAIYALKYSLARNPKFHRLIFGVASMVIDNAPEESYWHGKDPKHFIKAVMLTIGQVEEVVDFKGEVHMTPKSIAFENMDETEFKPIGDAVVKEAARILGISERDVIQNLGVCA